MKALITGGGGFLGSRIVQMLDGRGDEAIVLGRGTYPHHEERGIRTIQADIRDAQAITDACTGVDVVFHVAGLAAVWGKRSVFRSINVDGTQNVLNACQAKKVAKLVYTSTPSVIFGRDSICGVDESHPYPERFLAEYPRSKAEAEQRVLAANDQNLATCALRPHLIWGPGDPHLIPRMVDRARRGSLRQVGDGLNLVDIAYVDNVADAHVLAADLLSPGSQASGRAFFITQGEPVELWPWLRELLARIDAPPVTKQISYSKAHRIGALCEAAYRLFGIGGDPPMTRFVAAQFAQSHYFNIDAAREILGYNPRISNSEGMDRLVASLIGDPNGRI